MKDDYSRFVARMKKEDFREYLLATLQSSPAQPATDHQPVAPRLSKETQRPATARVTAAAT
jgi:hypothetical protein